MKNNGFKIRTLVVIGVLTVSMIVLFLVIFLVSFLISRGSEVEEQELSTNEYQFYQYNSQTNESFVGFVNLEEFKLRNDDFLYDKIGEEHTLITNFGSDEYQCSGSCWCEGENERKAASAIFSRSVIIYLLSAVSSLAAFSLAKEYFSESCKKEQFELSCSSESVRSEVKECKKVTESKPEASTKESTDEEDIRKYFCMGKCMSKTVNNKPQAESKRFNCKQLKKESLVTIDFTGKAHNFPTSRIRFNKARKVFMKDELAPFCRDSSTPAPQEVRFMDHKKNELVTKMKKMKSLCVGQRTRDNPTVRCRQVSPKPIYHKKK